MSKKKKKARKAAKKRARALKTLTKVVGLAAAAFSAGAFQAKLRSGAVALFQGVLSRVGGLLEAHSADPKEETGSRRRSRDANGAMAS